MHLMFFFAFIVARGRRKSARCCSRGKHGRVQVGDKRELAARMIAPKLHQSLRQRFMQDVSGTELRTGAQACGMLISEQLEWVPGTKPWSRSLTCGHAVSHALPTLHRIRSFAFTCFYTLSGHWFSEVLRMEKSRIAASEAR